MKKYLLISLVIAVEVFLLGLLHYCLAADDEYMGNYLMAIGSLGICIVGFVVFIKKTRALLRTKTPILIERVKLFTILPLFGAYMFYMAMVMLGNIINMYYHGYSMVEEWCDRIFSLFSTAGYLADLIFIESAIIILLILQKKKK